MEQELAPGREVWVKMPYGEFVIEPRGRIALFAGGTGITAFTAFLEQLSAQDACRVVVAYGARSDALLIYKGLVERSSTRSGLIRALYFLEHTSDTSAVPGRVAVGPVWPELDRPLETSYFIAGPPLMITALESELRSRGVPSDAIHVDAWE
jgi:toluene monooxygenase electron transfer component